jgi:hypothetical protein
MCGAIAKSASGWEGRKFPSFRRLIMFSLIKTDSPNCETETAKRTVQTVSLTVPADGYTIMFQKAIILM